MTTQNSCSGAGRGRRASEPEGDRAFTAHDERDSGGRSGALGEQGQVEEAGALLGRGRTLEDLGRPSEALLAYERALALPESERSPFDTGRLLHRVGVCAALTEDWGKAFTSHLLAARKAHDLGLCKPCGASLSAAGSILVVVPPAEPIGYAVSEDLAWTAFRGVVDLARETLLGADPPTLGQALQVRDRFAGLVVLSAFAALAGAPLNGSKALFHEVVAPFAERHGIREGAVVDEPSVTAVVLDHLARLTSHVADQGRQTREGVAATEGDLEEMVGHAALAFMGPRKGEMLRWLGTYLRDHRGAAQATGERVGALADRVKHS